MADVGERNDADVALSACLKATTGDVLDLDAVAPYGDRVRECVGRWGGAEDRGVSSAREAVRP